MDEQFQAIQSLVSEQTLPNPTNPNPSPIRALLTKANSIITKDFKDLDERVVLKAEIESEHRNKPLSVQRQSKEGEREGVGSGGRLYMEVMTLLNGYEKGSLIFKRYNNESINTRCKSRFYSSLFIGIEGSRGVKLPEYRGMLCEDDLAFDSNFESGNLMAVYKVGERSYDLVVQNDVNTRGFTQWYNFKVRNRRNNFIAKFNIVNLYKSKSLYSLGMKPIVRSEKSDHSAKKTWRRRGFNIYYDTNLLSYEDDPRKYYKTLSFQYDFTVDHDTVQFAHGIPYDLADLNTLLASIKSNPKVKVSTIGTTVMGRSIPLITISSPGDGSKVDKKALVILGRQHPGETPGSFIAEQMVVELLRNSKEVEFLSWRFDIFIIPMVNVDGVCLGNYRSNFLGFDLNRCWIRPDAARQPEVCAIKGFVRKLQRKYQVELVVDLHGHSRKMGSFFYGNKIGGNYMLLPYVASRTSANILFHSSTFSHPSPLDEKAATARVVLGEMLREGGGQAYTYEVSFFGNYREDRSPFAFQEEHYRELAKALLVSVCRTYLEAYREEKTLKESYFLKSTKTEIQQLALSRPPEEEQASGSDSEAEEEMRREKKLAEQVFEEAPNSEQFSTPPVEIAKRPSAIERLDREISIAKIQDLAQPPEKYNEEVRRKISSILEKNSDELRNVILARLPSIRKDLEGQLASNEGLREEEIKATKRQGSRGNRSYFPDYSRIKNIRDYDPLKIHGETFLLHEREQERHLSERKAPIISNKKEIPPIGLNITTAFTSPSKLGSTTKHPSIHLNATNIINSRPQGGIHQKKVEEPMQLVIFDRNQKNHQNQLRQFPISEDSYHSNFRMNRATIQKQLNRTRNLNKKSDVAGRLPPI